MADNNLIELIKVLRERTGAGLMDCKGALLNNDLDLDKACDWLREKGLAKAAKKADRIAAEGLTAIKGCEKCGKYVILEVNCETDFVAKNPEFKELTENLAKQVVKANPADVDALLASTCPCCNMKVEDKIKEKIAKIGEKITVRRFIRVEGCPATYIHNGKIGVLMNTDKADEAVQKDVCLHIASAAPEFVSRNEIPQAVIDEETRIEMGKEDLAKKPENIRAKIVEGRVNKLMAQKCLVEQPFIKNPDVTIADYINGHFAIKSFTRWVLGEGLEKRNDNFAEEVANQMKG